MIVVSDSTTLIVLHDLQKLEYLTQIFEHVFLPRAVYDELNYKNSFTLPNGFEVVEIRRDENYELLCSLLDAGESQAIALSLQKSLPLIIDEKKGRKIAQNLGIKILGLLGVLYLNIKKGFLTPQEAEAFLARAQENGYRISQKLIDEMLESIK